MVSKKNCYIYAWFVYLGILFHLVDMMTGSLLFITISPKYPRHNIITTSFYGFYAFIHVSFNAKISLPSRNLLHPKRILPVLWRRSPVQTIWWINISKSHHFFLIVSHLVIPRRVVVSVLIRGRREVQWGVRRSLVQVLRWTSAGIVAGM